MNGIYDFVAGHVPTVVVTALIALSAVFEVSKIPIDPWSRLGRLLGRLLRAVGDTMNDDLRERIRQIDGRMDRIESRQCTERKQGLRRAILRFADECRLGVRHSKEMFQNVLSDIDEYLEICKQTEDPNSVIEEAIAFIREVNRECMRNNTYL